MILVLDGVTKKVRLGHEVGEKTALTYIFYSATIIGVQF